MRKFNFPRQKSLKSLSGMPQMNTTLIGWEVPLSLVKITQDITEDGDLSTTETLVRFLGVWQPLRAEQLELKPEGQRSWEWYWIHAKTGTLNLDTADKVVFNDKQFKVMAVKDYSLNGFIEYELCRDYGDLDNAEIS